MRAGDEGRSGVNTHRSKLPSQQPIAARRGAPRPARTGGGGGGRAGCVPPATAAESLVPPAAPAVSGSWMATRTMIAAGDFAGIERAAGAAVATL